MGEELLVFGDLHIDPTSQRVILRGEGIDVTVGEHRLLLTLSTYPGRIFTRSELLEEMMGSGFVGYERTIDGHINNLRSKLGESPRKPRWLFTVHGLGYRFGYPSEWNRVD
jgi:DNA-binding response OmpR family regulator